MEDNQLVKLLETFICLPKETEWLEFKQNNDKPDEIGEYISALANSATLVNQDRAYIVWGIEDKTRQILGTKFQPKTQKIGNEEL